MRYGVVILPEHRSPLMRWTWRRADELGFDHAWTYDHLTWRWLRDEPWFGAVPTLAAAAVVTDRIRLGTLVANPGLRHPAAFAKDVATIDDLSGGRAIAGVGAGAHDVDLLGEPTTPAQRAARLEEFVEVLGSLLGEETVTHHGRAYTCRGLTMHPGGTGRTRVPIAVAGTGPRGMRLAAERADMWVSTGEPGSFDPQPYERMVGRVAGQVRRLEETCAETGRDPATIRKLLLTGPSVGGVLGSAGAFADAAGRFAEAGITDLVVHWPRPEFPFAGRPEVLDDIAAEVLAPRPRPEPRSGNAQTAVAERCRT